ncbi:MAG: hypothetical protein DI566_13235 [Microbacterium sp.]|nr:MAG: hypothetical protein DI566_13235 [Microbacterium sp.]
MRRSSRQGAIPSELGFLIDELDEIQRRLGILEAPSGESIGNAVAKLSSIAKPVAFYKLESPRRSPPRRAPRPPSRFPSPTATRARS